MPIRLECCFEHSLKFRCYLFAHVPKGSVLGPVLFIVHVNDTMDCICPGVTVKLFGDDAKLYSAFDNIVTPERLQTCLTAVAE